MKKSFILVALLAPSFCLAQTKEERKQEILKQISTLESEMQWVQELIKNNYWFLYFHAQAIRDRSLEVKGIANELQKELDQIELELKQEQSCQSDL